VCRCLLPGVECRRGRAALWTLVVGCPWWWLPWLRTVVALNWCSCSHLHLAPIGWPAARLAEARLWISVHGIEAWRPLDGLRRLALSRADLLLPVSRITAARLRSQLGVQCPSLTLLPNTYDAEDFSPGHASVALLERYGLFPSQLVVFSLCRLSRGDHAKHLDRLDTAMVKLRRSHPNLMLLIGGDGDDRARLLALVEDLGLQGFVLLPGRIADYELADHYRLASVFALPSEKEGFGILFLEALGCRRPVLAGNRDGLGGSPGRWALRAAGGPRSAPRPNICVPCWSAAASRYASIPPACRRRWPRDKFAPPSTGTSMSSSPPRAR